ncbi:filamentous hemagglutinin N-terminal domain-containing protein, partial [Salmonella enterica subsp. diarizonae]|nr:filamentous hemagglutinin N-terminal domain-containing protein [Salmonella enterica subsp. diarizonae]
MNKIYKLKFDKRRNELVVVSEIASGLGKEKSTGHIAGLSALFFKGLAGRLTPLSLLTGLILGALPMMTVAASLPVGGQVVAGQGSISVSGNAMTVQQSSQNMAANWQSFDIGKSHRVEFVQPDSSAIALNRVTGASASRIMGTLNANGRVFLVNPNGVVFGKDASVNTAGLVATTRDISTADFMKGKYTLRGESDAAVINQGSLKAGRDGFIVLAGSRVSNQGTIRTAGGKVVLAAAEQIHLQLDNSGLTGVTVSGNVVNALVDNQGLISAQNGQVYLTARGKAQLLKTVVKNSGTIEAQGLSSHGGVIRLDGGDSGVVSQSGTLLADSATDKGGRVVLEGKNIHLASGSRTSATGKKGGGSVHVGGGWKGQDSTIKNADRVVMSRGAAIDVSATGEGKGGTAVLWSETYTDFQGDIAARGGVTGGDGGKVETSSRRNLQAFGDVDASAPGGRGGQWLIDPTDVTIVSADTSTNVTASGGDVTGAALDTDTVHLLQPSAAGAQVSAAKIKTQLDKGTSVTVETSGSDVEGQKGNITVSASIDKTAGADATLTLKADKDITFSDGVNVNSTTGALGLSLLAGKGENASVTLTGNNTITLNGGDLYVGPQPQADERAALNNISLTANRGVNITAGNMTFDTAGGVRATNSADNAASAVKLNATGDLTINAQAGNIDLSGRATTIAATKNILFTTGNATLGRDINITSSGGDFTLRPAGDGGASVNFTNNGKIDAAGNITLDVSKGLRGLYYSLVAGKDLTVNGPVSLRAGWAVPSALTAGGLLKLTADSGNITFDSSDTANNGGNITLSAGKGINITAKAGKVELKSAAGDKNSLNVTATKGDVVLSARTNGVRAIRLEKALLTASEGNVSLQGTSGADTENAVDVRRGSVLTASQDITLTGQGGQTGLYLDNAILNATRTVTLKGVGDEKGLLIYNARVTSENTSAHGRSDDTSWVESEGLGLLGTSNLTAKQNISLSGSGLKGVLVAGSARAEAGEKLSINGYSGEYESGMGVALTTNASSALLKGKEVAITGTATASRGIRIEATKASIEAAERIVLKGTVRSGGEGVTVGNSDITLNAPVVSIEGNADKGVYFWGRGNTLNAAGVTDTLSISGEGGASGVLLNNLSLTAGNNLSIKGSGRTTGLDLTTLNLTITDPTKLSLSSAGSAAGAVNRLGAQAFGGADGLVSLVKKGIENRTLVNVTGASDSAADNKVIDNNRVSLVNLGKKLSGDGASTADTVIDLTHRASEGETARRGDWDFSAVDNITATTGDVIIKGVAGFGDSFTLNAAAGNIAI